MNDRSTAPRSHRALIVDDEAPIREVLRRYLEADGIEVTEAGSGSAALDAFRTTPPDIVVLDVMIPGGDGIEVLRSIRAVSDVPVIMLSARVEEADRVIGLSIGADDYVTKPFSPRELTLRVRNLLRRRATEGLTAPPADVISFPGLRIDTAAREVEVDGRVAGLTALEFDLLSTLARAPRRVFTRRMLLGLLWGDDYVGDERVVDVHIRNLRRAVGDDADQPRWIGTVRGVGYRFEAST